MDRPSQDTQADDRQDSSGDTTAASADDEPFDIRSFDEIRDFLSSYDAAQHGQNDPPLLPDTSFTAHRLSYAVPQQLDRESRVLAVGPFTSDWTQASPASWHDRYKRTFSHFSKHLGKRRGIFSLSGTTVANDSVVTLAEDVDNINQQTLADMVVFNDERTNPPSNGQAAATGILKKSILTNPADRPKRQLRDIVRFQLQQPSEVLQPLEPIASQTQIEIPAPSTRPPSLHQAVRSKVSALSSDLRSFVTAHEFPEDAQSVAQTDTSDTFSSSEYDSDEFEDDSYESDESLEPVAIVDPAASHATHSHAPQSTVEEQGRRKLLRRRRFRKRDKAVRKFLAKKKTGEILSAEKMLVMVKTSPTHHISSTFNELEDNNSRTFERWKEYVVVARKTGVRKSPILLQFHKTRYINRVERGANKYASKIDTLLTLDMRFKFYSTLDKTIVFWKPMARGGGGGGGGGTMIYILRPHSTDSSLKWLALFLRTLGRRKAHHLSLGIPHLGFNIDVALPIALIQQEQEQRHQARRAGLNLVSYQDMKSNAARATPLLQYLYYITIRLLNTAGFKKQQILNFLGNAKMGLAWRRFDRLEWVHQEKEESIYYNWVLHNTHDLEIRLRRPYLSSVTFDDGEQMDEPTPVEGYLMRVTNWKGDPKPHRGRSKLFFQVLYFHTHNGLLFFSSVKNALPPCPTADLMHRFRLLVHEFEAAAPGPTSSATTTDWQAREDEIFKDVPLVYESRPFETNDKDGEIVWLQGNKDAALAEKHDFAAYYEMERRVSIVSTADGFVNLAEVTEIKPVQDQDSTFELDMANGARIQFQASDTQTRNFWIDQLRALSRYWQRRAYEDTARLNEIRLANLARLNIREGDSGVENYIGESAPKWLMAANSAADPYLFSVVDPAWSRSIRLQAELYQKPSKYATFRKYHVVLCHSQLILYTLHDRHPGNGRVRARADHRKHRAIDLSSESCYVYSGRITEGDLLQGRDRSFDAQNPGAHYIPRVYADGWRSNEDEESRCFVLWFGRKRLIQHRPSMRRRHHHRATTSAAGTEDSGTTVRLANRLGVKGTSMVFMARSRQERDLWVLALNNELERTALSSTDDITIKRDSAQH